MYETLRVNPNPQMLRGRQKPSHRHQLRKDKTMTVIKFVKTSGKYVTPWGHEFDTEKEVEAFILGMKYVAGNVNTHCDFLLEKVLYTEKQQVDWVTEETNLNKGVRCGDSEVDE